MENFDSVILVYQKVEILLSDILNAAMVDAKAWRQQRFLFIS